MLDINFIRKNTKLVSERLSKKAFAFDLDGLLELDEKRRKLTSEVDTLRGERNVVAQKRDVERGKKIKGELEVLEAQLKDSEEEYLKALYEIPNLPLEGLPEGDESHNQVIRKEGEIRKFDFQPKDHVELGEILDIIDIPRAAKVSGSRFAYLKNEGVLLELALVHFAMDTLREEGFTPILPPVLIKEEITKGLGYWHGEWHQNYYKVEGSDNPLYLVGTSEHVVVPLHKDEILLGEEMPKKYVAFSSCFRVEAGAYGKDVRGILRVHQFDKVEMIAFVKPEDDEKERRKLLSLAENFIKLLGLPFQVVTLATGDLSFPAAETMDIETWIPSQGRYQETHSISTTGDFQSRRLNIKYREKDGKTDYAHILNGTAFSQRPIIAILENFQQKDGTVTVPEVLRKYTNFSEIRPKR